MRIALNGLLLVLCCVAVAGADVTQDANGWTVVTPSADSRIVYVSDSTGDDANDGLSQMAPKKTLAAGAALIRDGFPDHLLLKAGDTWTDQWLGVWNFKNGRSATEPCLISSYGTGARPLIKPGTADKAGWRTTQGCSYVALIGLHFHAHRRDPDDPGYDPAAPNRMGIDVLKTAAADTDEWILIEDCFVEKFRTNVSFNRTGGGVINDIRLRRNVIVDAYSGSAHSQGLFVHGCGPDFLAEENIFDHNGWYGDRDTGGVVGGRATQYNHSIYFDNQNPDHVSNTEDRRTTFIFRDNIFARSSASAIQLRTGGTFEGNLCLENASVKHGGGGTDSGNTSPYTPDGQDFINRNNVILYGVDIRTDDRLGVAIQVGNLREGSICDNIFAHDEAQTINTYGINIGRTNHATPELAVERNIAYKWHRGAIHNTSSTPAVLTSEEDNYWWGAADIPWPVTGTNKNSEDTTFLDPERSMSTYQASLGRTPTRDAFYAEIRQQSKANWRPEYTAAAVNSYIRAGFEVVPGGNQPPVAVDDALASQKNGTNPVSTNVLANDTDPDGDTLSVSEVSGNAALVGQAVPLTFGTINIAADGTATYTLDHSNAAIVALMAGQTVTDTVAYTCSDGTASSTANVNVTITGANNTITIPIPPGATEIEIEFN